MKKRNMNDYICKLLVRVRYLAMSFVIALLLSVDTVSAASDAKRVVSTTTSQIKSLLSTAYDLVFVLIGGVSMENLIIAIGKFMKEEHDSVQSIIKWGTGVILAVLFLTILKSIFF